MQPSHQHPTSAGSSPTDLVCLIDASPSMKETDYAPSRFEAACEAVRSLITRKIERRPDDAVALITFWDSWQTELSLTPVHQLCPSVCDGLGFTGDGTNFYGALDAAGLALGLIGSRPSWFGLRGSAHTRQPHIILLSDGDHNGREDPCEIAHRLKHKKGAVIDCIGIGSPAAVNDTLLRSIATEPTRYRHIGDTQALVTEFQKMAELRIV